MDYVTAIKKAKADKSKASNYLMINLSYNTYLILPYKDGMTFIGSLESAEVLDNPYSSAPSIKALSKDTFDFKVLSRSEYLRYRIAQLMSIPLDQLPTDLDLEMDKAA